MDTVITCCCCTSQSYVMLTVLLFLHSLNSLGRNREITCAYCRNLYLFVAYSYFFLLKVHVFFSHHGLPCFPVKISVVLCFTRQKTNTWFSLVCTVTPLTASNSPRQLQSSQHILILNMRRHEKLVL